MSNTIDDEYNSQSEYRYFKFTDTPVRCEIGWTYEAEDSQDDDECFHQAVKLSFEDKVIVARFPQIAADIIETMHEDCEHLSLWMPYHSARYFGSTKAEAVAAYIESQNKDITVQSRWRDKAEACLRRLKK